MRHDQTTFPHLPDGVNMSPPLDDDPSDPEIVVQADPSTSQLFIYNVPTGEDVDGAVLQAGMTEDSFHIRRQRLGLERARHLLKRHARSKFRKALATDSVAIRDIDQRIADCRTAAQIIHNQRSPLIEAADKYSYTKPRDDELAADIWQHHQRGLNLDSDGQFYRDKIEEIDEQYNPGIAETVVDVTFDIPYILTVDSQKDDEIPDQDVPTVRVQEFQLTERFQAVKDALEEIDEPDELLSPQRGALRDNELFETVQARSNDPNISQDCSSPPQLGPMPLIDIPANSAEFTYDTTDPEVKSSSPMSQVIAKGFNPLGTPGGVVYRMNYPDEGIATNWMVNPQIKHHETHTGLNYAQLWTRMFTLEQLLYRIELALDLNFYNHRESQEFDPQRLECPLCKVSPRHHDNCGGSACLYESYVTVVNNKFEALKLLFQRAYAG